MSGPTIKPRNLRNLLDEVLRSDSDLNAFCLDYFPKIYRQFAAGMDRSAKYTLLIEKAEASEILEHLRDAYPQQFSKYSHLLADGAAAPATADNGHREPSRVPTQESNRKYDRGQLFDILCKLTSGQFESVLFRLNAPMAYTPSANVVQATRSAELIRLLEQEGAAGLERLTTAIKQVAPLLLP